LILWEKKYREENKRQPTQEEKATKQKELIDRLPSNEQLQKQIFGKVIFKARTVDELDGEFKGFKRGNIK